MEASRKLWYLNETVHWHKPVYTCDATDAPFVSEFAVKKSVAFDHVQWCKPSADGLSCFTWSQT